MKNPLNLSGFFISGGGGLETPSSLVNVNYSFTGLENFSKFFKI